MIKIKDYEININGKVKTRRDTSYHFFEVFCNCVISTSAYKTERGDVPLPPPPPLYIAPIF